MLDPACPDITGRVIDALLKSGLPRDHSAIQRGVRYLLRTQERDGSWYGRWGVNYLYGTFLAMRALAVAAPSEAQPSIHKAAEFLRAVQNRDGGWGESCASYRQNRFVAMASTPSQSAWALLGLAAANDISSDAVQRGVDFLVSTQGADGGGPKSSRRVPDSPMCSTSATASTRTIFRCWPWLRFVLGGRARAVHHSAKRSSASTCAALCLRTAAIGDIYSSSSPREVVAPSNLS